MKLFGQDIARLAGWALGGIRSHSKQGGRAPLGAPHQKRGTACA